ncbi:hypothetical protein M1O12_05200 [Dehalococcoidia bacterium]|nr:hypothetical protein [Dehalococcoidia bacterium]
MLDPGGKGLSLFVGNFGILFTQIFEDKVRKMLNIMSPFLFATNIIDFSGLETINYISLSHLSPSRPRPYILGICL